MIFELYLFITKDVIQYVLSVHFHIYFIAFAGSLDISYVS
jgi:hypothetical protein